MAKVKCYIAKSVVYALLWGIFLFCSTYISMVLNWSFSELFAPDKDVMKYVMMPAFVVLALFLWDEAEGVEYANLSKSRLKKQLKWNLIAFGVIIVLSGIVGITKDGIRLLFLILVWICISFIKFMSMYFSELPIEINKV